MNGGFDMYIRSSSDFQCPMSGVPVVLVYDEETGVITAEINTFAYPLDKEENEFYDEELIEITEEWCRDFYAIAEDLDEANEIAEKYDCWF